MSSSPARASLTLGPGQGGVHSISCMWVSENNPSDVVMLVLVGFVIYGFEWWYRLSLWREPQYETYYLTAPTYLLMGGGLRVRVKGLGATGRPPQEAVDVAYFRRTQMRQTREKQVVALHPLSENPKSITCSNTSLVGACTWRMCSTRRERGFWEVGSRKWQCLGKDSGEVRLTGWWATLCSRT
jgi:hypothetical protein